MKHRVKNIHFVGIGDEPRGRAAFLNLGRSRSAGEYRT